MERPKRRKYKDNPYTLIFNKKSKTYMISFIDSSGNTQNINVSMEVYNLFNNFELEDIKELNEYDRHIEHLEMTEEELYHKLKYYNSLEDEVIDNLQSEEIKKAINRLSTMEKKRIIKYYFYNMNCSEIAKQEGVCMQAVSYSIRHARRMLKRYLKNFKI